MKTVYEVLLSMKTLVTAKAIVWQNKDKGIKLQVINAVEDWYNMIFNINMKEIIKGMQALKLLARNGISSPVAQNILWMGLADLFLSRDLSRLVET